MTPFLSTLYQFRDESELLTEFLGKVAEIVEERRPRRLNVLDMDSSGFALSERFAKLIKEIDHRRDLLFVFGNSANNSLVAHLLTGRIDLSLSEMKRKGVEFLQKAVEIGSPRGLLPAEFPLRETPRPGIYFRLSSDADPDGTGIVDVLTRAADALVGDRARTIEIVKTMRFTVALPHIEAYNRLPIGMAQACFFHCCDPPRLDELPPAARDVLALHGETGARPPARSGPPS